MDASDEMFAQEIIGQQMIRLRGTECQELHNASSIIAALRDAGFVVVRDIERGDSSTGMGRPTTSIAVSAAVFSDDVDQPQRVARAS